MQSTLQDGLPVRTLAGSAFEPAHPVASTLFFLAAATLIIAAAGASFVCLVAHRRALALRIAAAGIAVASGYSALLIGASLASRDRVLAPGDRKYFCEIDCHLAYSVEGIERRKTVGREGARMIARGHFTIVRLRVWFDPATTGPSRGNAPLSPGPRDAWLLDSVGKRHLASETATRALEKEGDEKKERSGLLPLTRALAPGESCETALVFDLDRRADSGGARLFVGDPPGLDRALVGYEIGPFHGKTYFAIPL